MKLRTVVMTLFSILMIGLVFWFVKSYWQNIREMRLVNANLVWVLIGLIVARMTLRGTFHWQVMRSLKVDIPFGEALALNFAGTMMNQVLPLPIGPGFRATYLKNKYDFPFSLFASTLAALFIYWLLVSATLGLLSAIWYHASQGTYDIVIYGLLMAVILGCLTMFIIPRFIETETAANGWLAPRIGKILEGWRTIVSSKKLIVGASIVVVLSTIVSAAAMYAGFRIFGIDIELPGALVLMASQRIGSLIKLTPGAIGYQEMVGVYFTTILAPTAAQAAVVFVLVRIANTAIGLVVGLPALWLLSTQLNASKQTESRLNEAADHE